MVRAVDAIAVELAGADARHKRVPVVIRPVDRGIEADDASRPGIVLPVEKQQLHGLRGPGEEAEVDAPVGDGGADWEWAGGSHGCRVRLSARARITFRRRVSPGRC